jgi:predicted nucleotide-binding protein
VSGGNRVFIGHGRSLIWRELKEFIEERLHLPSDEFNREPTAGFTTPERLEQMLESATFAFLIMTAEDEHADEKLHARENVVHEAGLFQGRLGMRRVIILREEGCQVFSNIHGLTQSPFRKDRSTPHSSRSVEC